MDFTPEQLETAKRTKSVEELLTLAKENGVELSAEEAALHFDLWHRGGALSDEELDNVSGGSQCIGGKLYSSDPPYWLITTAGNCCPDYHYGGGEGVARTCYTCWHYNDTYHPVVYCMYRNANDDPYR